MYYFACYELIGWYVKTLRAHDPSLSSVPLVVHRDKVVLDSCRSSRSRGIAPGTPLAESRAIFPEATFLKFEPDAFEVPQREWLDRLCRYVNDIQTDDLHRVWIDLREDPSPLDLSRQAVQDLERFLEIPIRTGYGPALWIAKALLGRDPSEDPHSAIADLPVSALPASPSACERLRFLGYPRIGDVRGIPLEALLDQFGEEAHAIHSACRAKGSAPFQPDYPARSLAASLQPEGGVADLERLDSVLDTLALRLGVRLRRMDRIAKRIQVAVQFESEVRTWERVFVKPLDTPRAVYFALKTLLEGKVRSEVLRVQARLLELERPRRVQRTLQGTLAFADRAHSADSAVQHLRQSLGDACVVRGSDWQVPRREKVLSAWRDATGWV